MEFGQVINATALPQDVYDAKGERIVVTLPKSDIVIRAGERAVTLSKAVVAGVDIPVHGTAYGELTAEDHHRNPVAVPEQQDGVFYVVALPVAIAAPSRTDFLVCGPAVRDAEGRMIGSRGLAVPHHPVVRREEASISTKEEIVGILNAHTGKTSSWDDKSPASLFDEAFRFGLVSQEEMDRARVNFGGAWLHYALP